MVSFNIPQKKGNVTLEIITREKFLEDLAIELTVMSVVAKLHPHCPVSPSGMFAVICHKNRRIMSLLDIHPLDIIIYMNKE